MFSWNWKLLESLARENNGANADMPNLDLLTEPLATTRNMAVEYRCAFELNINLISATAVILVIYERRR